MDTFNETQNFSPVFNKEFLMGILDLQLGLESIVTEKNGIRLADVCNALMSPQVNYLSTPSVAEAAATTTITTTTRKTTRASAKQQQQQ